MCSLSSNECTCSAASLKPSVTVRTFTNSIQVTGVWHEVSSQVSITFSRRESSEREVSLRNDSRVLRGTLKPRPMASQFDDFPCSTR